LEKDPVPALALNNYRYGELVTAGIIDEANVVFDSTIDL
jgi:hypothetical protein